MKKIIILAVLLILALTGCKKNDNNQVTKGTVIKEIQGMTIIEEVGMKNVFSSTRIQMPSSSQFYSNNYYDRSFIMNDRIYFAIECFEPEVRSGYAFVYFYSYDFNGENEEYTLLNPVNEDAEIKFAWYDSEYNVIIIEELDYIYTLSKYNTSGEIVFSLTLNDIIGGSTILSMVIGDEENNIYIAASDNNIYVFSPDDNMIWKTSPDGTIVNLSSAHGKPPIIRMHDAGNANKYQFIDAVTQTIRDSEMRCGSDFYMYSHLVYGDGYDYFHIVKDGVYGYDIASNTLTKVLDWTNSDLIFSQLRMITVISTEKIFFGAHDLSDYKYKIYMLDHVPNDQIPEKTYISIGYINSLDDAYLSQVVAAFNRKSDEYRITLTNFHPKNGNPDMTSKLNAEIAAGNTPDLLYINSYIPPLIYAKNDLFDDLYEYLTPELTNNLLPFVTDSVEFNGKLPQLITKFTVKTLIGKTKNVGVSNGWSISDMLNLYKSLPDDVVLTYELTQNFMNEYILDNIISECIDYTNGICNFNQQGFKDYIELYSLLPEYYDWWSIGDYNQFTKDNYAKCRNDEMIFSTVSPIGNVLGYIHEQRLNFRDEEVNFIGFPTMNGNKSGDYIESTGFSILSTSKNKEAAWEFIKFCISDEFAELSSNLFVMLPTYSALNIYNDWHKGAVIHFSDINLDYSYTSVSIEDARTRFGDGIIEQINDDWIDEFNAYIESVDNYVYKDKDVRNIVTDELTSYINTNKSIDDTIKAIQSRVSIYMSEMWE